MNIDTHSMLMPTETSSMMIKQIAVVCWCTATHSFCACDARRTPCLLNLTTMSPISRGVLGQSVILCLLSPPSLSFNLLHHTSNAALSTNDDVLLPTVLSSVRLRPLSPTGPQRDRRRSRGSSCLDMGGSGDGSNSFRTEVDIPAWPSHTHVGYEDSFVLLGSCFSESIGARLERSKMESAVNPSHGLLFSPLSTAESLDRMVSGAPYRENESGLVFSEGTGLWCSLDHHSTFSSTSRRACLEGMNVALARGRDSLLSATCIFVTLGTAWVFRHCESNKDVANCHKLPAYAFERRIVPVHEIAAVLQKSITNVLRANPKARVILTVSPVRHWRDGPVENARSKAHLLAGVHGAIELLREQEVGRGGLGGPGHVSYFPSYEVVNDDLRDYRFYEPDMVHPNSVAVDYIWDKLVEAMFSDEAMRTMAEIEKVMLAKDHRPFNPRSDAHQRFLRGRLDKLDALKSKYPKLALDEERAFFQSHILETATM